MSDPLYGRKTNYSSQALVRMYIREFGPQLEKDTDEVTEHMVQWLEAQGYIGYIDENDRPDR